MFTQRNEIVPFLSSWRSTRRLRQWLGIFFSLCLATERGCEHSVSSSRGRIIISDKQGQKRWDLGVTIRANVQQNSMLFFSMSGALEQLWLTFWRFFAWSIDGKGRMRNGGQRGAIPSTQGENSLTKRPIDNSPSAATSLSSSYCTSYTLYAFVVTR